MLKKIFSAPVLFCISLFLLLPVCVHYRLMDPFITPRVVLMAATVLVLMLVVFFQRNENPVNIPLVPLYSFLAFLILMAMSISASLNPGDAWYEWMKTFLAFPVMLLTIFLFRREEDRTLLLKFSQVAVLILSAFYCYQWVHYFNNKKLDLVLELRLHIASTMGNKNFYAELACMLLPFSVISFFTFNRFWKWLGLFNSILLIITVLSAESFAALAAMMIAFVVVAVFLFRSRKERSNYGFKTAGIALAIVIISAAAFFKTGSVKNFSDRFVIIQKYLQNPALMDSTARVNSNSTFERIMLWRNSFGLIKENPALGCGAANWKLLYPKFGIGGTRYIESGYVHYEHPHNDYLLIASESGIPALAAFLIFLFSLAWIAAKGMKEGRASRLWLAGILFAVISFIVVSNFSFPRARFYCWMLLGVYAGLLFIFGNGENVLTRNFSSSLWKGALLFCASVSIWLLIAGVTRLSGEEHSKLLQLAKAQKNLPRIIRESERSSSYYFPVDETATPFTWYKGMALFYSRDIQGAKAAYEDALKKNPYHIQLLNDAATAYEQTNERERAIELYRRALEVTPNFTHSLLNISACYFNSGKIDSAYLFIDKIYGIKLISNEQISYDNYLPAILREKIKADSISFPAGIRERAIASAVDAPFITAVYQNAKKRNIPLNAALADSLMMR